MQEIIQKQKDFHWSNDNIMKKHLKIIGLFFSARPHGRIRIAMNKIVLIAWIVTSNLNVNAQCEEKSSAGSISFHFSMGKRNGFGGELGEQGILNNLSFFLGVDFSKTTKGYKGKDSTVSLVYVKGLFRFYQNHDEDFSVNGFIAPALLNTDFELLSGVRLLYVTGRMTAISVEPSYFLNEQKFCFNICVHFLLD
jgi:hypothetical protein